MVMIVALICAWALIGGRNHDRGEVQAKGALWREGLSEVGQFFPFVRKR